MTFLPIASNVPFGAYMPLVVVLAGFAVVSVVGTRHGAAGTRPVPRSWPTLRSCWCCWERCTRSCS